jgi:site-specific recombinase XerD
MEDFEIFLNSRGLSEKSKNQYRVMFENFMRFVNKEDFDQDDVLRFVAKLNQENKKPRTVSLYINMLRSYLKFKDKPVNKIKLPRIPLTFKIALTKEELKKLFEQKMKLSQRVALMLMAYCGLRMSEVFAIKKEDVDFNERIIKVHGKGAKERIVIFNEEVGKVLKEFFESGGKFDFTPRALQCKIKTLCKRAGIKDWEKITPHSLRGSFATIWSMEGGPEPLLKRLLGHTPDVTTIYSARYKIDEMKEWYDKIFGKGV